MLHAGLEADGHETRSRRPDRVPAPSDAVVQDIGAPEVNIICVPEQPVEPVVEGEESFASSSPRAK
jgi:hypothetical protein